MTNRIDNFKHDNVFQNKEALKQLAEKQMEEMDTMLAKKYGLLQPHDSFDQAGQSVFAELFSGLPVTEEKKENE